MPTCVCKNGGEAMHLTTGVPREFGGEGSGEGKQRQLCPCETATSCPLPQGNGEQRERPSFWKGADAI